MPMKCTVCDWYTSKDNEHHYKCPCCGELGTIERCEQKQTTLEEFPEMKDSVNHWDKVTGEKNG